MSYDLVFWRQIKPLPESPDRLCERIYQDEAIDGIAELPIEQIKARFAEVFVDIEVGGSQLWWEGPESAFVISWPPDPINALIANCGYDEDTMNKIIDIANEFGCALYDPQIGRRFDEPG